MKAGLEPYNLIYHVTLNLSDGTSTRVATSVVNVTGLRLTQKTFESFANVSSFLEQN